MKQTDIIITSHLRKNARKSLTEITKETGIPTSTIHNKIKNMEKYIIKKFTVLLDYEQTGHHNWNITMIKIKEEQRQEFEEYTKNHPNINTMLEITNEYNYQLETVFKNLKEYADFIRELQNKFDIEKKQEHIVLKEHKQETFEIPEK
ncbi:Lrp/AsnC family transcriptional regulator [Candidatus Woesearchaeota archaeon]|nr:Lrp/AsnC family transcriptional regulator [Candidatus Woesearchaeota archaeon]